MNNWEGLVPSLWRRMMSFIIETMNSAAEIYIFIAIFIYMAIKTKLEKKKNG